MLSPALTPIQQLQANKERVLQRCSQQEEKLNQDFLFVRENAGSLLLSGLSGLLFPKTKKTDATGKSAPAVPVKKTPAPANISFSDYLSLIPGLISGLVPIAWEVAKPVVTAWGIKKAQHWLTNLLSGKKKKKINN